MSYNQNNINCDLTDLVVGASSSSTVAITQTNNGKSWVSTEWMHSDEPTKLESNKLVSDTLVEIMNGL